MFVLDKLREYARTDHSRTALVNRGEHISGEYISFARLDRESDAFAAWLLERFGDDRSPVLLYGHKESALLPCLYGALKSGRAYVPIDAVTPPARAEEIAAEIQPKAVVDFTGTFHADAIVLDSEALSAILQTPPAREISPSEWVAGEDTAYILFTSGSTGKPKGVPITADNLTAFHRGLLPWMSSGEEKGVVLNQVSYAFDVSCCSLYTGLALGMTLFTVDKGMTENLGVLLDSLAGSGLTTWVSTPSFAEICMQSERFSGELLPKLERFLFCGEVLTHKLCDQLAERFPTSRVINTYGPTEATVLVTAVEVDEALRRSEHSIPIGAPVDGMILRIVDGADNALAGEEEPGELLLLGGQVGPGYYGRPDLTAGRFFEDAATGLRGYRTGDICYRKAGLYYYTGRADNQLKLGGYRIELEDIESNLARVENVSRAAVLPVWEGNGDSEKVQYLTAFLLLEKPDELTPLKRTIQIKKGAAAFLPAYMIPRKMVYLDAFPLNQSGKIDKKALAERLVL